MRACIKRERRDTVNISCQFLWFKKVNLAVFAFTFLFPLVLSLTSADADDLLPPTGKILLTVTGNIGNTTDGTQAQFDRAGLEALGMQTLDTNIACVEGVQHFEGILFSSLLNAVAANGNIIKATALDDYSVEIPMSDIESYHVILAMKWNGKTMRVRDKGPIWVIYPIDQHPELSSEVYGGRSIWQLVTLTVQ